MAAQKAVFIGQFEYSLDSKGRLAIPSAFRKALGQGTKKTLVITKGLDQCLVLMAINEWEVVADKLSRLYATRKKHRQFVRWMTRYATFVRHDSQGRIVIPQTLIELAELEKNVVIIGALNKIEIWNPALLTKAEEELGRIDGTEFEDLADDIMI